MRNRAGYLTIATALVGLATACGGETAKPDEGAPQALVAADPSAVAGARPVELKAPAAIVAALEAGEPQDVLVIFDDTASESQAVLLAEPLSKGERLATAAKRAGEFAAIKAECLAQIRADGLEVLTDYSHLPMAFVRVHSIEALEALAERVEVYRIGANEPMQLHTTESLPLIGQPGVAGSGKVGAGSTIAVLDSGVDYSTGAFGTCAEPAASCAHSPCETGAALTSGCDACVTAICAAEPTCCTSSWSATCTALLDATTECASTCSPTGADCSVLYARDFDSTASDAGDLDNTTTKHGTAAASVVRAVAPGADVVSLDVYNDSLSYVYRDDAVAAMNWVLANQADYGIVGVVLAFGGADYVSNCDTHELAPPIDALRSAGILTVVSAGNSGRTNAIASPACVSSSLSVGAVYDSAVAVSKTYTLPDTTTCTDAPATNGVPCFSNSAGHLDMLAPGAAIVAPGMTVPESTSYSTSMAAAHVAGAIAVIAAAFPTETVDEWEQRILLTGAYVYDYRNGVYLPRLDLNRAAASCVYGATPRTWNAYTGYMDYDDLGGTGAIDVTAIPSTCTWTNIALTVPEYYGDWASFPNDDVPQGTCGHDLCFTGTALASGCSSCTDSVCGFESTCCATEWDSYCVMLVEYLCGLTCGRDVGAATSTFELAPGVATDRWMYLYVEGLWGFVIQNAWYGPPQGSVSINGGALFSVSSTVTLGIPASDGTEVGEMCIGNEGQDCTWEAYAPTKSWALPSGQGERSVYVKLRDVLENEMGGQPYTDSIFVDLVAPVNGTVSATGSCSGTPGSNTISWSGFGDGAGSGINYYRVVGRTGSVPLSCYQGTVIGLTTSTSVNHNGLIPGTRYYYRVCAVDNAGRVSTGATASAMPHTECNAPTGTVTVNGGAAVTTADTVTLTFTATDVGGTVTGVCYNTTGAACADAAFVSYAPTKTYTFSPANVAGTKTVYAWFRDSNGNVSTTAATDDILRDVATLTATASTGATPAVALSWAGATPPAGITSWKVVYASATGASVTPPADCTTGTTLYEGTAGTFNHTTGVVNGTIYGYRVCAVAAGTLTPGKTATARPKLEAGAPTGGSVVINGGDLYTATTSVTVTLTAPTDASTITHMCISNSTTVCAADAFVPFATSAAHTLTTGAGTKTVRVWFRDEWFNVSASPVTDTITLDTTGPTGGTVTLTPSALVDINVAWSGFTSSGAGVAAYKVVFLTGTTYPAANCTTGTVLAASTALTSFLHSGLTAGTTYSYRVCGIDSVGNIGAGVTKQTKARDEVDAPVGSFTIGTATDMDPLWVKSASVTLYINATDATGVARYCVSNTTTCSSWTTVTTPTTAFTGTKAHTLTSSPQGTKTVYVRFEDTYGNQSAMAVTDTVGLDTTAPVNGAVTATAGALKVTLALGTGWTDATSGIAGYKIVVSTGASAPTSCSVGTVVAASTTAFPYEHTGLTAGTTYRYRICAIDTAGNMSTGTTATAAPTP